MFGKVSTFITQKKYEVFYMDLVDFAALFWKTALVFHTMSELALTTEKGSKSFDHSEFFFMHWTK